MGEILPKKFYLRGFGLGEHPKKFGTSYLFLQPLKLATSNLEHKLGLELASNVKPFFLRLTYRSDRLMDFYAQ